MARIPQEELERLKREISVQRLVESKGVKLQRHGKDLIGLCPLHNDTSPSLVVSPKANLWNCLGACGKGGSVIDWVMAAEGVSFRHAVEILREGVPATDEMVAAPQSPSQEIAPVRSTVQKVDAFLDPAMSDEELLLAVVEYYHQALLESAEGMAYLEKRGLHDEEMVRHFRLGLADRTLGYRLPAKSRKASKELRARLQELGVLRASGHEHLNGSLVIPVFDADGGVATMYGRKIGQRLRKGTPLHLYLPGGSRPPWNLDAVTASEEVILCESLIDALTFWVHGFSNVTTSYGVNGRIRTSDPLNPIQVRYLIAYDRDDAGDRAAAKHAEELQEQGVECYRVQFPKGMDANEYALKVQPARQSLDLALRKAVWMGEGEAPLRTKKAAKEERDGADSLGSGRSKEEPDTGLRVRCSNEESKPTPRSEVWYSASESPASSLAASSSEPKSVTAAAVEPESVLPQAPKLEIPTEVGETEITITLGDRRYRVRGMEKNLSYDTCKINLAAFRGDGFHVDSLDLYSARQRTAFLKASASELGTDVETIKRDLGKVLLKLEELQDAAIKDALAPKEVTVTMSQKERERALSLLRDERLLERIGEDLGTCGLVGEESNKLVAYLVALSRKLENPLAVVVQSSSAAGKSTLMDAVLALVPEEDRVSYSAMTGQSLYYLGEKDLKHKVLAVAEEEGAERASYALKLLQSEGELSIASTGKDPVSGRLQTQEYHVEGPVALMLTTTAIEVDEELLNRCLVLTVDEGREQTRAIHERQRARRTLEGLRLTEERKRLRSLHQNAQRLLEPLRVVNPYAPHLTFLDVQARTRRDHEKYLTLIDCVTLLHQHQRERGEDEQIGPYLVTDAKDIELANALAHEVMGRCLDELPPQTRRLLSELDQLTLVECKRLSVERSEFLFTRRFVREALGWGDTQLRVHLERLVELEYLLVHQGRRGRSFVYELVYEGEGRTVARLLDAAALEGVDLNCRYDSNLAGSKRNLAPPSRPQRGGVAGASRVEQTLEGTGVIHQNGHADPEKTHLGYQQTDLVVETVRRREAVSG